MMQITNALLVVTHKPTKCLNLLSLQFSLDETYGLKTLICFFSRWVWQGGGGIDRGMDW